MTDTPEERDVLADWYAAQLEALDGILDIEAGLAEIIEGENR